MAFSLKTKRKILKSIAFAKGLQDDYKLKVIEMVLKCSEEKAKSLLNVEQLTGIGVHEHLPPDERLEILISDEEFKNLVNALKQTLVPEMVPYHFSQIMNVDIQKALELLDKAA